MQGLHLDPASHFGHLHPTVLYGESQGTEDSATTILPAPGGAPALVLLLAGHVHGLAAAAPPSLQWQVDGCQPKAAEGQLALTEQTLTTFIPPICKPLTMCSLELLLDMPQLIFQPGRCRSCGCQLRLLHQVVGMSVDASHATAVKHSDASCGCLAMCLSSPVLSAAGCAGSRPPPAVPSLRPPAQSPPPAAEPAPST